MPTQKHVALGDFLTEEEIQRAINIWKQRLGSRVPSTVSYAQTICDEITAPNIERINRALGQENDPKYLAYMIEFAMMQASRH